MTKNYKVTVNGAQYSVTVEQGSGDEQVAHVAPVSPAPPTPTAKPAPAVKPAPTANPEPAPIPAQTPPTSGGTPVTSPLPGAILEIKVSVGAAVEQGAVVAVIEAMKMENEIVAPAAGTVTSIAAAKGQIVAAGDPLIYLG